MHNFLSKLAATLLILILLPSAGVHASGKMEVRLGEKVTLQGQDIQPGSSYKWVAKLGKEIVATQTNAIFNYAFNEQGEYEVNLTVTDRLGDTRSTSVAILAGSRYSRPGEVVQTGGSTLAVFYSTLPAADTDGRVHLLGEGRLIFDIEPTREDILEYRIDQNIFEDSDGNGVANDDIDNSGDDSYLLGGVWEAQYKITDRAVAEITEVASNGEKAKAQVELVFDSESVGTGAPKAVLDVMPYPDEVDKKVYLYGDEAVVSFYSRKTQGDISEYRIDRNIFEDSNGDGNPSNDIDNLNDVSFKNGDAWKTTYPKSDGQIIAQLIAVGRDGTGSRIQRELRFSDAPPPSTTETPGVRVPIALTADKPFVQTGDPITFTVVGLKKALDKYTFIWDFNGDGTPDQEVEGNNTAIQIYDTAEVYMVKVTVTDDEGKTADFTLETFVRDAVSTAADFEYTVDSNKVTFQNLSTVSANLANPSLSYQWSFGDTDEAGLTKQKDQVGLENPEYSYKNAGTYIVTLTVTDSADATSTHTEEIQIDKGATPEIPFTDVKETQETPAGTSSWIMKTFKIVLYLVLIVVALLFLILGGLMTFLKVQHPDLTFEELVDELKIKILAMMGIHDMITPVQPHTESKPTPEKSPAASDELDIETPIEPKRSPSFEEKDVIEGESEEGPMPDWMKEAAAPQEKAKEKATEAPKPSAPSPAPKPSIPTSAPKPETPKPDVPLDKQDGPKPDWLK